MPKISKRGIHLPASPIRKLVVHADKAKERGIDILHLNIGQPDVLSPKVAMDKVREAKLELLPYGSSQGPFSYRKK
ncbi:MAG: pyridoxal phosphate-dependent aminotransferase, partial [Flavobacteriales bacterium]